MKDVFINIVISMFFITKSLLKTLYIKSKKAIAIAWPFIVRFYRNFKLFLIVLYIGTCLVLINTFSKNIEED